MSVQVSAATDPGLKRPQNEDRLGFWVADDDADRDRRGVLLVVADGMGGSRGGEIASQLAVETVLREYREAAGDGPLEELAEAVRAANRAIQDRAAAQPELRGMGTTCTAVVLRGGESFVAHVGDSRAYRIRGGRIEQLTRDHSLVAQLVESRQITPEQARIDPRRNLVTRSVGVASHVEVDAGRGAGLAAGETLLLCTDGLHGLLSDEELRELASAADLDEGCRALVALARERGGPDNITVVLARLDERARGAAPTNGPPPHGGS